MLEMARRGADQQGGDEVRCSHAGDVDDEGSEGSDEDSEYEERPKKKGKAKGKAVKKKAQGRAQKKTAVTVRMAHAGTGTLLHSNRSDTSPFKPGALKVGLHVPMCYPMSLTLAAEEKAAAVERRL